MSKLKLSNSKFVKVQFNNLLTNKVPGKYFPVKPDTTSTYLSVLRVAVTPEHYNEIIDEFEKQPFKVTNLLNGKYKKKIKELDSDILAFVGFESEFQFAKIILQRNYKAVNTFLALSKEYSNYLIQDKFGEANQILDKIEGKFGYSLWLIKQKIALLQFAEGLESQKKYTQKIKNELKSVSTTKFIAHWTSIRNEDQTSVGRFTAHIESTISKLPPQKYLGFHEHIQYHLLGNDSLTSEQMAQVLRMDYSFSFIDYYESFATLIQVLACENPIRNKVRIQNIVNNEKYPIRDPRFEILKHILIPEEDIAHNAEDKILPNYYLIIGEYTKALKLSDEMLATNPSNPVLIMIRAYANSMINGTLKVDFDSTIVNSNDQISLLGKINDSLCQVLNRGLIESSKDFNELKKIALNFSNFSWVSAIKLILAKENSFFKYNNFESSLAALRAEIIHPFLMDTIDDSTLKEYYISSCYNIYGDNTVSKYYSIFTDLNAVIVPDEISATEKTYAQGLISYKTGAFEVSVKHGQKLINESTSMYYKRRAYGLICRGYLKMGDLSSLCINVADSLLSDRSSYPFLPLLEIKSTITPGTDKWREVNSLIDLSIVFDACVRFLDKGLETARRFAYEDFLEKNGVEKPSQLDAIISNFQIEKIVYYLRFICIETIMDMSGAFEGGSHEVVEERLAICRLLISLDATNENIYRQEIKELVRKQVIRSRRQEVDQSRIYVDIQSVKDWAEVELKENFDRYQAYIKSGLVKFSNKPDDINEVKGRAPSAIEIPENEVNALLAFMINEIKNSYLSADIGLDRFISTRVRHGELARNMRSPIQKYNLITKKAFQSGPYMKNDYWIDKLSSTISIKDTDRAFSIFSELYDTLIAKITKEWLQIKKSNKPDGLFDFDMSNEFLKHVSESITAETTVKQFIDLVIGILDNKLIFNLVTIREKLNKDAKAEAKTLLNNLQEAISKPNNTASTELQGAISQARTDLQAQFEKIIEWFVPSSSGNSTPYIIHDAMMVAEAIIKEENANFKINIDGDEESTISIHGQLPIFVDIFVNIFENVVKRSGLEIPEAEVTIWADETIENFTVIFFKIANNLGADIDIHTLDLEMKRKKGLLMNGSYSQYLATEKDSGLFKIHKSVHDFSVAEFDRKPTMDFGIEENLFQVTISVPFQVFLLDIDEKI